MLTSDARTGLRTLPPSVDGRFATDRAATVERVTRSGIPRGMAEAWIDAWVESTEGLRDFREARDFWTLGYRFAVEEYRRGYRPAKVPEAPTRLHRVPTRTEATGT